MKLVFWIAILMAATVVAVAQRGTLGTRPPSSHRLASRSAPGGRPAADPKIASALSNISAAHIRDTITRLAEFHTRQTLSAAGPDSIAEGRGIGAAREWIKSEFERYSRACGGCLEVHTDTFVQPKSERVPAPTEIVNVYAVLRGSDAGNRKRIYLVTGHYDSRNSGAEDATGEAPGANDDASGTAVSLECARVLSQLRFPATIIFLAVAGEEQGLYGSEHFAKMAKQEAWQIEAVLNNDIVGGDRSPGQDPHRVRLFSEGVPLSVLEAGTPDDVRRTRALGGENDSASRELARYIADIAAVYLPSSFQPMLIFRPDRFLRGGDHLSFNQEGFAAVRFTEYRENYNHQHQNVRTEKGIEYGDLPKFVNFDYVANVARVNAASLAALASAPAPPAEVRLLAKELENTSTLQWQPSPGGLACAYEVLWRSTTAPLWERSRSVGSATRVTLEESKDNVIFAVRSVDVAGHRSLPVTPTPEH